MEVIADAVRDYGMSSTNYMFMLMKLHEFYNAGPRGEEKDAILEIFKHCYQQTGTFFRNTLFTSVNNPRSIKGMQAVLDPIEEDGSQGDYTPTKKLPNGEFAKPLDMDTLVPRKDMSKDMAEAAGKLCDKNWKVRMEGIEGMREVPKSCGGRLEPKFPNSLWQNLRAMQKDTNKNLTIHANKLIGEIVTAGGEKMAKITKEIIPQVFPTAGDQKKPVAAAAGECVKIWALTVGYEAIVKYSHEGLVIPKARPVLIPAISEVLNHYDGKGVEMNLDEGEFMKDMLSCCLDKDAKIKTATKGVFPVIIKHAGGKAVVKCISNEFKSGDQASLQKGLKKFLGDIEEEPKKGKKGKKDK